jgi:teichuronic acid biosynthesis glycosyltransferase TuaG
MSNAAPLVSIITPLYNSEEFIEETLDSVQAQTYTNWEMLLIDDCSTDRSVEIARARQQQDPRFKVSQLEKNSGSGPARNEAIRQAEGKYLAFLDSDDLWVPEKLSRHVQFMEDNKAVFSHTSYGYLNEAGERINNTYHVSAKPVDYRHLLKRTEISCLTAMYDQHALGKKYMPDVRRKQDYGLWLSILRDGNVSHPLDEELAFYRQRKGSATSKKHKLIMQHVTFLRKYESLSLPSAVYYTAHWLIRGIFKYYL